jgi:hypothetical protein
VALAAQLTRSDVRVVLVDTLPEGATATYRSVQAASADIAWRLRMLEREAQLAALTEAGVPIVAWRGPGTLDQVLRRLARRPPRVRR